MSDEEPKTTEAWDRWAERRIRSLESALAGMQARAEKAEAKIAALESRLAEVAPVVEAALTWQGFHDNVDSRLCSDDVGADRVHDELIYAARAARAKRAAKGEGAT